MGVVFSRTADAATLRIAWDPSPDPEVVGYKVSIGTQSGVYTNQVDAGTQTAEQFSNLTGGATYYFVVQAYDRAGSLSLPSVEVAGAAPLNSPLAITCPAPSATSPNGAAVAVTFSTVISGGTAPTTGGCSPGSGSLFPVGVTPVQCTANDAANNTAMCTTTVLVTAPPPAPPPPATSTSPAAPAPVDLVGSLSGLAGKCPAVTFRLNGKTIAASQSTAYDRKSCSSLGKAKQVEVKGTTQSNGSIAAQTISILR